MLDGAIAKGEVALLFEDLARGGGLGTVGHLLGRRDGLADLLSKSIALGRQLGAEGFEIVVHWRTVRAGPVARTGWVARAIALSSPSPQLTVRHGLTGAGSGQDHRLLARDLVGDLRPTRSWAYGQGMNDPYEVLQVHRRAEPEVIRAAYRALARKYHPDFGGEPARMAEITGAWAALSNAERRAAYDAESAEAFSRRSTDRKGTAPASRQAASVDGRAPIPFGSGTVIDFGRYVGWTIGSLVEHDPDYLEWLARTPIGRRLSPEIDAALARRESDSAALRPPPQPLKRRRSLTRPWASAGSSSR